MFNLHNIQIHNGHNNTQTRVRNNKSNVKIE